MSKKIHQMHVQYKSWVDLSRDRIIFRMGWIKNRWIVDDFDALNNVSGIRYTSNMPTLCILGVFPGGINEDVSFTGEAWRCMGQTVYFPASIYSTININHSCRQRYTIHQVIQFVTQLDFLTSTKTVGIYDKCTDPGGFCPTKTHRSP